MIIINTADTFFVIFQLPYKAIVWFTKWPCCLQSSMACFAFIWNSLIRNAHNCCASIIPATGIKIFPDVFSASRIKLFDFPKNCFMLVYIIVRFYHKVFKFIWKSLTFVASTQQTMCVILFAVRYFLSLMTSNLI